MLGNIGLVATSDEVHYSPLTNAYVASWLYEKLEHPH
jgi:hypothetical protein